MTKQDKKKLDVLSQIIFDKKGVNIIALDVRHFSTMADYYLIAEGSVDRHVKAICNAIKEQMKEEGSGLVRCDGEKEGDWIVMDYGNIMIHLLIPDMREKYALETLWKEAKIIDVVIKVDSK